MPPNQAECSHGPVAWERVRFGKALLMMVKAPLLGEVVATHIDKNFIRPLRLNEVSLWAFPHHGCPWVQSGQYRNGKSIVRVKSPWVCCNSCDLHFNCSEQVKALDFAGPSVLGLIQSANMNGGFFSAGQDASHHKTFRASILMLQNVYDGEG